MNMEDLHKAIHQAWAHAHSDEATDSQKAEAEKELYLPKRARMLLVNDECGNLLIPMQGE